MSGGSRNKRAPRVNTGGVVPVARSHPPGSRWANAGICMDIWQWLGLAALIFGAAFYVASEISGAAERRFIQADRQHREMIEELKGLWRQLYEMNLDNSSIGDD
jgi:hypothetical protein